MGVVWVHWLMARGQILKESLVPLATPYVVRQSDSKVRQMSDRCPTVRQRPTVRQSDSSDSCPTVIMCVCCHTPLRQLRQLRQGSDSSDSSPTAPTAPLLGWLHLIGMPLVEVHPSRKVSFGKCSHQGVAHWHQYTLQR